LQEVTYNGQPTGPTSRSFYEVASDTRWTRTYLYSMPRVLLGLTKK